MFLILQTRLVQCGDARVVHVRVGCHVNQFLEQGTSIQAVEGQRIERVIADEAEQRGLSNDEIRDVYLRQTSMRSFASPDEVADTVLYLASRQSSRISGQAIAVDGHTEGFLNWLT